jgi:hypothetical protein
VITLAFIWGIVTFLGFCLGLIPCLGWLNWLTIPLGIGGVIIGILATAQASGRARRDAGGGQAPGRAIAGLVLSAIAVAFGSIRLLLGGGVF